MIASIICAIASITLITISLVLLVLSLINGRPVQIIGNGLSFIVDLILFHAIFDALSARPAASLLGRVIEGAPTVVRMLLVFILLILSITRIFSFHRTRVSNLSPFSMSEALNKLPTGIIFATKNGQIFQTNEVMEWLHDEIIVTPLRNAKDLWENAEVHPEAIYRSETPRIFESSDGRKWIFTRNLLNTDFDDLREIHAIDVTREVEMMEEEKLLLKDFQRQSRKYAAGEMDVADGKRTEALQLFEQMDTDLNAANDFLAGNKSFDLAKDLIERFRAHLPQ